MYSEINIWVENLGLNPVIDIFDIFHSGGYISLEQVITCGEIEEDDESTIYRLYNQYSLDGGTLCMEIR